MAKKVADPLLGKYAKMRLGDGNPMDGVACRIFQVVPDDEGTMYRVQTTECVGAQPAGIVFDLHRYELEIA